MSKILLSVCIPTYNRSDFLIQGLETWSKVPGFEKIEIVIADDCSNDDSTKKVEEFKSKNKKLRIVYKRFSERQYFDKMVLSLAGLASGKFMWLISDDDIPRNDALKKIFNIIEKHPDVSLIHLNYSRYDNLLKKVTATKMVPDISENMVFTDPSEFLFKPLKKAYFKFLGTNVITMSTDIVNRDKWIKASKGMEKFIGHNFIHSFVIFRMIKMFPKIYYVADPIVQYLSNNHRVWPNDIWKDYNDILLGYLEEIGYPSNLTNKMRIAQSEYENREAVMKNKYLGFVLNFLRPVYSSFQYLKNKL